MQECCPAYRIKIRKIELNAFLSSVIVNTGMCKLFVGFCLFLYMRHYKSPFFIFTLTICWIFANKKNEPYSAARFKIIFLSRPFNDIFTVFFKERQNSFSRFCISPVFWHFEISQDCNLFFQTKRLKHIRFFQKIPDFGKANLPKRYFCIFFPPFFLLLAEKLVIDCIKEIFQHRQCLFFCAAPLPFISVVKNKQLF